MPLRVRHYVHDTLVLLLKGALYHGTPAHNVVGTVLQEFSPSGRSRHGETLTLHGRLSPMGSQATCLMG
jgi:hypothetical protein